MWECWSELDQNYNVFLLNLWVWWQFVRSPICCSQFYFLNSNQTLRCLCFYIWWPFWVWCSSRDIIAQLGFLAVSDFSVLCCCKFSAERQVEIINWMISVQIWLRVKRVLKNLRRLPESWSAAKLQPEWGGRAEEEQIKGPRRTDSRCEEEERLTPGFYLLRGIGLNLAQTLTGCDFISAEAFRPILLLACWLVALQTDVFLHSEGQRNV